MLISEYEIQYSTNPLHVNRTEVVKLLLYVAEICKWLKLFDQLAARRHPIPGGPWLNRSRKGLAKGFLLAVTL